MFSSWQVIASNNWKGWRDEEPHATSANELAYVPIETDNRCIQCPLTYAATTSSEIARNFSYYGAVAGPHRQHLWRVWKVKHLHSTAIDSRFIRIKDSVSQFVWDVPHTVVVKVVWLYLAHTMTWVASRWSSQDSTFLQTDLVPFHRPRLSGRLDIVKSDAGTWNRIYATALTSSDYTLYAPACLPRSPRSTNITKIKDLNRLLSDLRSRINFTYNAWNQCRSC